MTEQTIIEPGAPLQPKKGPQRGKKSDEAIAPLDPAEALMQVLERATPEQRSRIAKKMGITDESLNKRRRRRQQQTNSQIRQFVMANGDVAHPDPNFLPDPPERVSAKGPVAVEAWHEAWLDGKAMSERQVAALDHKAEEARSFQAEMERRIDAGEFQATGI